MSSLSEKIFRCEKCNFITSRKNNLARHLLTPKHKRNSGELIIPSKTALYKCSRCSKTFKTRSGRSKHEKKHGKTKEELKDENIKLKFEMYEKEIELQNKQIKLLEENVELLRLEIDKLKSQK